MELYVAICEDRHIDVRVCVFTVPEMAIRYCKDFIAEQGQSPEEELDDDMRENGWIYNATYGVEGDAVRVERVTVDDPNQ